MRQVKGSSVSLSSSTGEHTSTQKATNQESRSKGRCIPAQWGLRSPVASYHWAPETCTCTLHLAHSDPFHHCTAAQSSQSTAWPCLAKYICWSANESQQTTNTISCTKAKSTFDSALSICDLAGTYYSLLLFSSVLGVASSVYAPFLLMTLV